MTDRKETQTLFDEFPELVVIARCVKRYLGLRGIAAENLRFVDRLAITVALMENARDLKAQGEEFEV